MKKYLFLLLAVTTGTAAAQTSIPAGTRSRPPDNFRAGEFRPSRSYMGLGAGLSFNF